MSCFVQARWGDSEDNPSADRMREVLDELDVSDPEHPDTWLVHESEWTLSAFESGLIIWDNPELSDGPRYREQVSRDEVLHLWELLSRGEIEEIESLSWKEGSGPPVSDEELRQRLKASKQMTLGIDKEFYDLLGPEDDAQKCRAEGCERGVVRFSVLCRPHHFENVRKKPSPFIY